MKILISRLFGNSIENLHRKDSKRVTDKMFNLVAKYSKLLNTKQKSQSVENLLLSDPDMSQIIISTSDFPALQRLESFTSPDSPSFVLTGSIDLSSVAESPQTETRESRLDRFFNDFQLLAKDLPMSLDEVVQFLQDKIKEQKPKARKSLSNVCKWTRYDRLGPSIEFLQSESVRQGVTLVEFISMIGRQVYYQTDRNLSEKFSSLVQPETEQPSKDDALLFFDGFRRGLGTRKTWTDIKHQIGRFGVKLPSYGKLTSYRETIIPKLLEFHHAGVGVKLLEGVSARLKRILQIPGVAERLGNDNEVKCRIALGMDGAAGYTRWQHVGSFDHIFNIAFTIVDVTTCQGVPIFEDNTNSPFAVSPWKLVPEQESRELFEGIMPILQVETTELEHQPFPIEVDGRRIQCRATAKLSMVDGKVVSYLTGRGGSKCVLCKLSAPEYHDRGHIEQGFVIEFHSIDDIQSVIQDLRYDETSGKFVTHPHDYHQRFGVTRRPLVAAGPLDPSREIPTMHAKLHFHDWFFEYLVPKVVNKSQEWFSKSESVKAGERDIFLEFAAHLEGDTGRQINRLNSDRCPGNLARFTFSPKVRDLLHGFLEAHSVPQQDVQNLLQAHQYLTVLIRLSGCSGELDVDKLRNFQTEVYLFLFDSFPILNLTPSLHQFLAHLWELVAFNDGRGLGHGGHSEEALESSNKALKKLREGQQTRAHSTSACLEDTFKKRWCETDPVVRSKRRIPHCSRCRIDGHWTRGCSAQSTNSSTDDDLVQSFFL